MNRTERDDVLDAVVARMRAEQPDPSAIEASARRVGERLGLTDPGSSSNPHAADSGRIESCAGFRQLVPGYIAGSLSGPAKLLLQDHLRDCVRCRAALREAREGLPGTLRFPRPARRRAGTPIRWAAVAAGLAGLLLAGYAASDLLFVSKAGAELEVMAIEGGLYRVSGGETAPLEAGARIPAGGAIRTARDSGAILRMADGSRIEMKDRTELSASGRRDGSTILLARGDLIVEASPQGPGHLDVRTTDCLVSVKGTIFAVHHGLRGSRVSVVEGAVAVEHGRENRLLRPGEQLATEQSLGTVPVGEEIAWSRDVDRYVALLGELERMGREIDAALPVLPARRSTRLLDLAPPGTILYAAIPNLTESLDEAIGAIQGRMEQSPALREWWESQLDTPAERQRIEEALGQARALGRALGDEIVITLQLGSDGKAHGPTVLAEVKDLPSLRELLDKAGERIPHDLSIAIDEGVLFVRARDLDDAPGAPPSGAFPGSAFHRRLAQSYEKGAHWLLGADLHAILTRTDTTAADAGAGAEALGFMDVEHFIVEREEGGGRVRDQAVLAFDRPRRGLASWLAAPGPMGSLDFVSPEATMAAAFVVRRPGQLLREVQDALGRISPDVSRDLGKLRTATGIDPLPDLADPLGSDFTVAIDGPILPVPSWKLAMEVYDAAALQNGLEKMVGYYNREREAQNDPAAPAATLTREDTQGRAWYTLHVAGSPAEIHYVFLDGYLLAAPSRALLIRTMQQREAGHTLGASRAFAALLPADGREHFSALLYENVGHVLGPLAERAARAAGASGEARDSVARVMGEATPHLIWAYADTDRITLGTERRGGLGEDLAGIIGLSSLAGRQGGVFEALRSAGAAAPAGGEP